jgi:transporter family protein
MQIDYPLLATIAMLLWGLHFFLVKLISRDVGGPTVALYAQALIVVTLACYIFLADVPFLPEETVYLGYTILASLLLSFGLILLYMAIQRGPLSVVAPVHALNAAIAAALGVLILGEAFTIEKAAGLVLAIAAIILLSRR